MSYLKLFVVSLPRSGSTVLTNLLDQYEDIHCMPESFFPAAIEACDARTWADRRRMAALFVASCSDGSPLNLGEAENCMREDKNETLDALARAVACKVGRDPATIRAVVWKFTRLVGRWRFANTTGGLFLILHRNPLNVFESQFRVPFGEKNRNPFRFALFEASYAAAFKGYPTDRTRHLDYCNISAEIGDIAKWIGSSGVRREEGARGMGELSGKNPWHAEINKPFKNRDPEKLGNLKAWQISAYRGAFALLAAAPFIPQAARKKADERQAASLLDQADSILKSPSPGKP